MSMMKHWIVIGLIGLSTSVSAQVITFDRARGLLTVPSVQVGADVYRNVTFSLSDPENYTFRLTGAVPQSPPGAAVATYDAAASVLTLPAVQVGTDSYANVTLKNVGGYVMQLTGAVLQASSAAVQINLGDAPSDSVLAVAINVTGMTFKSVTGESVPVLTTPRSMEVTELMGTVAPLALAAVPQGTYDGAAMTLGNAIVTFVDPSTGQVVQRTVPGPMTVNVAFDPPLAAAAAPMVVNLDMNLGASVSIDSGGHVSVTPALSAVTKPVVAGSVDPEDGGVRGLTAMVDSVSGSAFSLAMTQGLPSAPMTTDAVTQFSGLNGIGMMSGNMLVSVDAMPLADGSWLVSRVQPRAGAGGSMAAGVITALSGSPPTQLTVVMRQGIGLGMRSASLAGTATIAVDDSTDFAIDSDGVDLSGLPFTPRFDRTSLSKGQSIDAWSSAPMTPGGAAGPMTGGPTIAAASIQLHMQGVRGTVSSYASSGTDASFELTLPTDSALARLTGVSTITVYRRAGTQLRGLSAVANGNQVLVRGLLFLDGGTYRLVASRIVASGE